MSLKTFLSDRTFEQNLIIGIVGSLVIICGSIGSCIHKDIQKTRDAVIEEAKFEAQTKQEISDMKVDIEDIKRVLLRQQVELNRPPQPAGKSDFPALAYGTPEKINPHVSIPVASLPLEAAQIPTKPIDKAKEPVISTTTSPVQHPLRDKLHKIHEHLKDAAQQN